MIRKFIAIKNVGRYRNSAYIPNPQLARYVFILGANGHGKTTLCDVLRSLQTGNAACLTGRKTLGAADAPTVEFLMEGGGVSRFDGVTWNSTLPTIAIYDGTFIADNVHAGDVVDADQRRNLYRVIFGHAGMALAEEEVERKLASPVRLEACPIQIGAFASHIQRLSDGDAPFGATSVSTFPKENKTSLGGLCA